ncbi:MAG: hypothetical protein FWD85_00150 [Microbacteriaceae bacterium]|nr:hypothetical protein [Microbacteriaceae bacterium]MCL2793694.1 hypothetical protein [Microbacteriaceae bacterium]
MGTLLRRMGTLTVEWRRRLAPLTAPPTGAADRTADGSGRAFLQGSDKRRGIPTPAVL